MTLVAYDVKHKKSVVTDPLGAETLTSYDEEGRPVER